MQVRMLWVGTSKNTKVGNGPNGYVGSTIDEVEDSCEGCDYRDTECYYWMKNPRMAHGAMMKANKTSGPERYSLKTALKKSVRTARYARGAVGGDPNVFSRAAIKGMISEIRRYGLKGMLLYTHFPEGKGAHLKGLAMASAQDLSQADRLVDQGWRVFASLPYKIKGCKLKKFAHLPEYNGEKITSPDGRDVPVCPAQRPELRKDCQSCGLCDATQHGRVPIVGALMH